VSRRTLGWAATIVVVAFVIVLAVSARDRGLALFALLLLVGALALAGLVLALLATPTASSAPLALAPPEPDVPPADLDQIEYDVREALATGIVDSRLRAVVRAVAAARLESHAQFGDGPLARLLAGGPHDVVRMAPAELVAVIGELERR